MSDDIAISVKNISKNFLLPHERQNSIKSSIVNIFQKKNKTVEVQHALKDISFDINKGDFFGIVGKNGSGKSTLLKIIAGIYQPTGGKVTIDGKLVSFIELGVGFNPELTGRENVYLNGALLGFTKKQIDGMYDEIVEFAELEEFMDQKLKNYSSGMQVRLAFSVAIKADGDILVLDEVLAVGDEAFQRKCFEYFAQLKHEKKTVILVTHSMDSVERFCNRAVLINDGLVEIIGNPSDVAGAYQDLNKIKVASVGEAKGKDTGDGNGADQTYFSSEIRLLNQDGKETDIFTPKDKIVISVHLLPKQDIENAFIGVQIKKMEGEPVFRVVTEAPNETIDKFHKGKPVKLDVKIQNIFHEGSYMISVTVKSADRTKEYFARRGVIHFGVITKDKVAWNLQPEYDLTIKNEAVKSR